MIHRIADFDGSRLRVHSSSSPNNIGRIYFESTSSATWQQQLIDGMIRVYSLPFDISANNL